MEAIEEYSAYHYHHDRRDHHSLVVKGKRTKRLRLPSPPQGFVAAVTSSSSTACEYNSAVSPSSSSGNNHICESTTEEEEDMAYCLILLAQGDAPRQMEEEEDEESDFQAKKFSEVPVVAVSPVVSVSAAARGGFDVYECKTCNRVFPSFQALGGHRASHKKPKMGNDDQKKPPMAADFAAEGSEDERFVKRSVSPPLSLLLASNNKSLATSSSAPSPIQTQFNNRPKIHGCSICGSEFTSGQALGGHMRRHRAPPPVTATRDLVISEDLSPIDEKPRSNILELDLNLPAPEEEKFQFAAAQPPIVVFSAPALVDCHY